MKTVRAFLSVILAAIAFCMTAGSAEAKVHLKIAANSLIIDSLKAWTASTQWDQINNYSNTNANRPTVDLLLQLQALKAGGLDFDFEFVTVPNYERGRMEMTQGSADISAETVWDNELTDKMLRTDPVIRNGEFEKGLYVLPTNEKALKVKSIEEVRELALGTVATWDVATVEAIHSKKVEKAGKIENVIMMIDKQRADYVLLEFSSSPDLSLELAGVKLVPIPNCKVALQGSRSWAVSKASPNATEIHTALVKGLKAMRDDGRIERAFKESGFLNQKVATWKRLL